VQLCGTAVPALLAADILLDALEPLGQSSNASPKEENQTLECLLFFKPTIKKPKTQVHGLKTNY
jgi:hypothetical protein